MMISSTRGNLKQNQDDIDVVKSLGVSSSVGDLVHLLKCCCNFV